MNIYLDNAATTKLHPKVVEKMLPFLNENYGNPSSIHSFGRKTRVAIEDSREFIADFIHADPSEIYFTSGGTEATNFIINGIAQTEFEESGRKNLVTSAADHKATLNTIENLVAKGFGSKLLDVNKDFEINYSALTNINHDETSLLSVIHVNNETGTINNIKKISSMLNKTYFHIDAVQSFGKINIDVNELGINSLSASAHKLHGPKGIGLAYVKSGTPLASFILGGGQERNRRAGTENAAAIVGFAEAVKIAKYNLHYEFEKVKSLKKYLFEGFKSNGVTEIIENKSSETSPYILSVTFNPENYKNDLETMLMFLDINGIAASSGSACSSGTLKPSHVILAAGYSEEYAKGTLRFSFNSENTFEELDYTIEIVTKLAQQLKK